MVESANHLGATGALTATYGYDGLGTLTSQQYPISQTWASGTSNTFTYTLDALERPTAMTDSTQKTWASGVTYNAANQPLYDGTTTRTYNNLLQMTSIVASGLNMTYNYSATKNNGQITSSVDGISGETVTYTYDALKRLSGASSSASWSAGYTFDGYGNLLGIAGNNGPPSINLTAAVNASNVPTNQIQATGVTYDSNGNQTAGFGGVTFSYDAANRMVTVGGSASEAYAYDAQNLRVYSRNASGAETIYFYGADGKKLATYTYSIITYQGGPEIQLTQQSANVYFLGKLISAEGNAVQVDRLGSVRSGGPGGLGHQAQYPYGVEYTVTASDREKYATYTRDSATGLDYAMNRYYASQWGRFMSPDPYGGSTDPGSPQSWNLYPYVGADPVNSTDPSGLYGEPPDGPDGPGGPSGPGGPIIGFNPGGGGWGFGFGGGYGCDDMPNAGNWYDPGWGVLPPWAFGPTQPPCEQGFLPTVGPRPGGGGGGLGLFLALAVKGAEAVLENNTPCDQLFNTGGSSDPAASLQSAYGNNQIRWMPFGENVPAGVGAQTTGVDGIIQIASNRYFVTGILANGTPVTQATSPNFQGLSLSQVDDVILIHELLHFTGAVGSDNAGQTITLGNGATVTGSVGVTNEVRKDCLHQ